MNWETQHGLRKNIPEIVSCLQDKDSLTRQAAASTLGLVPDAALADPKKLGHSSRVKIESCQNPAIFYFSEAAGVVAVIAME